MPSIYTDDSRFARYAKLRTRKKAIEYVLDAAMIVALILAAGEIIPDLLESILGSMTGLRPLGSLFLAFAAIAGTAAVIFAIYKKDWRITAIVLLLTPLLITGGVFQKWGILQPVPLAAALICDLLWLPLTKEEGFPQFHLELDREAAARQAKVYTARKSAVDSGVRTEATGEQDMRDLLSEEAESINADLTGYQSRSQHADPLVHAREQHDSVMDTLEEL